MFLWLKSRVQRAKSRTSNLIGVDSLIIISRVIVLCSYYNQDLSRLVLDEIKGALFFCSNRYVDLAMIVVPVGAKQLLKLLLTNIGIQKYIYKIMPAICFGLLSLDADAIITGPKEEKGKKRQGVRFVADRQRCFITNKH